MTTFTWTRGRGGVSGSIGSDTLLACQLATYDPGASQTIRRLIVDWGLDLEASEESDGAINGRSPVTLGLISAVNDSPPGPAPGAGPDSDPGAYSAWWQGAWYGANYGIAPDESSPLLMSANGRIDRQNNLVTGSEDGYTTWWLVAEIQDAVGGWNTGFLIGWYQFLTAPTIE